MNLYNIFELTLKKNPLLKQIYDQDKNTSVSQVIKLLEAKHKLGWNVRLIDMYISKIKGKDLNSLLSLLYLIDDGNESPIPEQPKKFVTDDRVKQLLKEKLKLESEVLQYKEQLQRIDDNKQLDDIVQLSVEKNYIEQVRGSVKELQDDLLNKINLVDQKEKEIDLLRSNMIDQLKSISTKVDQIEKSNKPKKEISNRLIELSKPKVIASKPPKKKQFELLH